VCCHPFPGLLGAAALRTSIDDYIKDVSLTDDPPDPEIYLQQAAAYFTRIFHSTLAMNGVGSDVELSFSSVEDLNRAVREFNETDLRNQEYQEYQ
jgi:hypothetical protein